MATPDEEDTPQPACGAGGKELHGHKTTRTENYTPTSQLIISSEVILAMHYDVLRHVAREAAAAHAGHVHKATFLHHLPSN